MFVFLFLASCGKSGGGSSSSGDAVTLEEIESGVTPSAALNFNVNVRMDNDFTANQEDKIHAASDLIRKVIGSDEFRKKVLAHSYNGKKGFVDNGGLSNAQVYKAIIEGSEKLSPGVDNEMDLSLEVFRASTNTVGYTMPSELRVWMNEKYLDANKPYKVTTNMVHEWLHKLGFKHAVASTATRKYSVPYAIGYLVARIAQKYD
ncbi:MAG: hypothetical protein V4598_16690 [Bdellovibrionota bacterium]